MARASPLLRSFAAHPLFDANVLTTVPATVFIVAEALISIACV